MIVDAEKLIGKYLRANDVRVVGKTPSLDAGDGEDGTHDAWVKLVQLDAQSVGGHRSDYFIASYCQFDCYAGKDGGQPEAISLGRQVRQLLVEMPGVHSDGTVTGVEVNGMARVPDEDLKYRERVILTVTVWMHP